MELVLNKLRYDLIFNRYKNQIKSSKFIHEDTDIRNALRLSSNATLGMRLMKFIEAYEREIIKRKEKGKRKYGDAIYVNNSRMCMSFFRRYSLDAVDKRIIAHSRIGTYNDILHLMTYYKKHLYNKRDGLRINLIKRFSNKDIDEILKSINYKSFIPASPARWIIPTVLVELYSKMYNVPLEKAVKDIMDKVMDGTHDIGGLLLEVFERQQIRSPTTSKNNLIQYTLLPLVTKNDIKSYHRRRVFDLRERIYIPLHAYIRILNIILSIAKWNKETRGVRYAISVGDVINAGLALLESVLEGYGIDLLVSPSRIIQSFLTTLEDHDMIYDMIKTYIEDNNEAIIDLDNFNKWILVNAHDGRQKALFESRKSIFMKFVDPQININNFGISMDKEKPSGRDKEKGSSNASHIKIVID